MPLVSEALTTAEAFALRERATQDLGHELLIVENLINAVSERMSEIAGRSWYRETDRVDDIVGEGWTALVSHKAPIVSVTSLVEIDSSGNTIQTYTADDFDLDLQAGILYSNVGRWPDTGYRGHAVSPVRVPRSGRPRLRLTYTCGWITPAQEAAGVGTRNLPFDLEEACLKSVHALYRSLSADLRVISKTSENAVTSYRLPNRTAGLEAGMLLTETANVARSYYRGEQ